MVKCGTVHEHVHVVQEVILQVAKGLSDLTLSTCLRGDLPLGPWHLKQA